MMLKRSMPDSSLNEWLRRLELLHPVEIELGLERVTEVARSLGLLESPPRTITVAGTNGKGSVVAVVSAGLRAAGFRVGTYTSPHLVRFNERICIDEVAVADADLVSAFSVIDSARGQISLTYFEFATLAALWLFRERRVDWQVLEVGLGGRLDAVNIIDADFSAITSIGLDHIEWLGSDRETIAIEKAGVARQGQVCVVADPQPPATLIAALSERGSIPMFIDRDWRVGAGEFVSAQGQHVPLPEVSGLLPANIGAGLQVLELAGISLDSSVLSCVSSIHLPGRRHRLRFGALEVWLDVAHNTEAVRELVAMLRSHPCEGATRVMFGVMGDKPIRDMISACREVVDEWNVIELGHVPRAMPADQLAEKIGLSDVVSVGPFATVWDAVMQRAEPGDRIVIFGSFFTVGAAYSEFGDSVRTSGDG